MKLNEFLKELNKIAYTSFNGKVIKVYVQNNWGLEEDDWFLKINPSVDIPVVGKQWKNLEGYPLCFLREVLDLIGKLEGTPIKERFSEKKYTIQTLYDDEESYLVEASDNNYYFGCLAAKDGYGDKVTFTSDEIKSLKNNKRIAIDWNKALITPWVNND